MEATPTVAPPPTAPPDEPTVPPTIEPSPTALEVPPTLAPIPTAVKRERALPQAAPTRDIEPSATVVPSQTATPSIAVPTVTARRPSRTPSPTPTKLVVAATESFATRARPEAFGLDPLTAFVGGGLAVAVGLALGLTAAALATRARRRNARRGAATAMLAELRWIDAVLRKIADRGSSAADLSLDHPIVSANLRDLALFEPETAGRIADLHYHLRAVEQEMQRYRENPKAWVGRLPELDGLIRQKAVSACRVIAKLSEALQKAGGTLPPLVPARDVADREAGLPTSPFGESESDDWTL